MRNRWLVALAIIFACSAVVAADAKRDSRKARRKTASAAATLQSVMNFDEGRHSQQVASIIEETELYTGIHVGVDKNLKGVTAKQLKVIATIMANADIQPPDRIQRFSWIPEQLATKITGWDATIIEMAPTAEGIHVRFRVMPLHAGNAGLMTTDYALETYMISDSGAQLLQIGFPPHRGAVSFN